MQKFHKTNENLQFFNFVNKQIFKIFVIKFIIASEDESKIKEQEMSCI